jgi:hypothetical protein
MFTCGPAYFAAASNLASQDPYFSSVVLLCHFDGTNGQTSTVDSSSKNRVLSGTTGLVLSSAQAKFGATSSYHGASGGSTAWFIADSDDWDFGSGPFTIEGWMLFATAPGANAYTLAAQYNATGNQRAWQLSYSSSTVAFFYSLTGSAGVTVSGAWSPAINTWYHMAVDRDPSGVVRVYVDGVVKASATVTAALFNSTMNVYLGGNITSGRLPGYIDEVRITKGVARYAGAFTPPTAAFPNS